MADHMQIGEVADRTGLSLRTIRYYEEVGLVVPSARSQGGFRLYSRAELDRLDLIKRMKPLGLDLAQMRELLAVLDPAPHDPPLDEEARRERLRRFHDLTEARCAELRSTLDGAETFATMLRTHLRAPIHRR